MHYIRTLWRSVAPPLAFTTLGQPPSPLLSAISRNHSPFPLVRPCILGSRMRTPKQTEASRANGAKSKGPVTPQGKINSSRNSTRHGMFADTIVLEAEDREPFLQLLDELFEEHQPRTRTEVMLVETLAAARWRQDRIWGMQKVAFDYDVASAASLATLN